MEDPLTSVWVTHITNLLTRFSRFKIALLDVHPHTYAQVSSSIQLNAAGLFLPFSYKRKLKAAKAMNSAATVVIENQKSGPVVPGTNKYTKEG